MLSHLFQLIWNRKRTHALLIVEIWASFLVLFGLMSLVVYNAGNYREPLGFSYQNVWAIDLNNNQDTVNVAQKITRIMARLRAFADVESTTRMSNNSPFSASNMNSRTQYKKASVLSDYYVTDENFARTLDLNLIAGRWYRGADSVGKYTPVVINQKMQEALFEQENPLGKVITKNDPKYQIVGVVGNFKAKGEFAANKPALFELVPASSSANKLILVRVKPGTDATFEAQLVQTITAMVPGWSVDVDYLTDQRQNRHNLTLVPVVIFGIVCAFLLINVALGLFGVLNLSIARRRGEIGLRRALGATGASVAWQFVGEMWVLATFALVLGLGLAGQFPLLNVFDLPASVYLTAMAVSVLIIYGLVTLCALFPSRQAARIQPATALHEE